MAAKIKSSEWSDFSHRIARIYGLPEGTEVRLYRKNDGRRVRSDLNVKRYPVSRNSVAPLSGSDRVSDLLTSAMNLLSTDIVARGLEIRLYGPDGNRINGNTHLQTVRNLQAQPQDNEDPIAIFLDLLSDVGIDDLSIGQVGLLYRRLCDVVGGKYFDEKLRLAHASG